MVSEYTAYARCTGRTKHARYLPLLPVGCCIPLRILLARPTCRVYDDPLFDFMVVLTARGRQIALLTLLTALRQLLTLELLRVVGFQEINKAAGQSRKSVWRSFSSDVVLGVQERKHRMRCHVLSAARASRAAGCVHRGHARARTNLGWGLERRFSKWHSTLFEGIISRVNIVSYTPALTHIYSLLCVRQCCVGTC